MSWVPGRGGTAHDGTWAEQSMVSLPARSSTAASELLRRLLFALGLLVLNTLIVFLDRDGYADHATGDQLSLIDAFYYTTVSLTTTGYGDITPIADHSRLINALIVTPLRLIFLAVLVGTTIEVLAHAGRRAMSDAKWRKKMRGHTVVLGYGTMGRSAVATLRRHEVPAEKIVVVDSSALAVAEANRAGYAGFEGDVTYRELLRRTEISKAREIIITVNRDDTAILATLTVRQLNPSAHVVVAVREADNVALVRQSGADAVVTSSDAVGRLMALSSVRPQVGLVVEDLLSTGEGLEVVQRYVTKDEVGLAPTDIATEQVLAVIRNKTIRRFADPRVGALVLGDEVIVVRSRGGATAPID